MRKLITVLVIAMASVIGASAQVADGEIVEGMKYRQLKRIYDHKDYSESLYDRYYPVGAGVASFFVPGLGQMLSREVGRGFAWFGAAAAAYIITGVGNVYASSGEYYGLEELADVGAAMSLVGGLSLVTIDICAIVDAKRVAKVKNMYEQDLRRKHALSCEFHPSVNYIQTSAGLQPTAGFTLALKF